MTDQLDAARGRGIAARWCNLAEQRLEHLTELFETGRWRRYHSERAFLENIEEARTAVEIWRDLSTREASRGNSALDISWFGRSRAMPPSSETPRERGYWLRPLPAEIRAQPPRSNVSIEIEASLACSDETPSVPETPTPAMHTISELTLDISAIQKRYPLLRNAL
jgi:uncharacterized repeat protein (TIGR03809 family)